MKLINFFIKSKSLHLILSLILITASFSFLNQPVQAVGIYDSINFQGKVVNSDGTNVPDTSYTLKFRIYDSDTCGTGALLWGPDTKTISTTSGVYQTEIGDLTTPLSTLSFNRNDLYVELEFNTQIMCPRIHLTSSAYAINSEYVNGLTVQNTSSAPFSSTTVLKLPDGDTFTVDTPGSGATDTIPTLTSNSTLTNKTIGSTGLVFSGATTDITTGTNEDFAIVPNGTGKVGIGLTGPGAELDIKAGGTGTKALFVKGNSSNDANIAEFQNNSGTPQFSIDQTGNITSVGTTGITLSGNAAGLSFTGAASNTNTISTANSNVLDITANSAHIYVGGSAGGAAQAGTIGFANRIQVGVGTTTQAGISFNGDANAGFNHPANDNISIVTSGAEQFRVDASGNVGIGTTGPGGKLDVTGTVTGTSAFDMQKINLTNQTTSGTQRGLVISQLNDAAQTQTTEQLAYFTNLDLTSTVTDGLLIDQNASGSTMTNGLHITNTAGTLTSAITIDGAGGAPSSKILDTASLDISGAGAISGATGLGVLGTTTINDSGSGATTIGNASSNTTINVGSDATGDLLYRSSGGNLARLAVGSAVSVLIGGTTPSYSTSSGNSLCLQSNGSNTALTWASCGGGAGLFTQGTGFAYLTSTTDDLILGASSVANATFNMDVSAGMLYLGKDAAINGGITLYSSGVGITDPSIYADSSGNLNLSAPSGTVKVGAASGSITLNLGAVADLLTASKTVSLSGAYTSSDYTFNRTFTTGANSAGGAVMQILDDSVGVGGTVNPDLLLIKSNLASGTFTGNLLHLVVGSSDKFRIDSAGAITLAGGQTADVTSLVTTNVGAALIFSPGITSTAGSTGATFTLAGGKNSGTSGTTTGGTLALSGGDATDTAAHVELGGNVTVTGGTTNGTGANNQTGGNVTIAGGAATTGSGTRNGGAVAINGGQGTSANGAVTIGNSNTASIALGTSSFTGTIGIGNSSGGALSLASSGASSFAVTSNTLSLSTTGANALSLNSGGALSFTGAAASSWSIGSGNALTLTSSSIQVSNAGVLGIAGAQSPADITSITAGNALTVQPLLLATNSLTGGALNLYGGDESASTSPTGGALALRAGNTTASGAITGTATGGNFTLNAGNAAGSSGTRNGGSLSLNAGTGGTLNGNINIGATTAHAINLGNGTDNTTLTLNGTGLTLLGGSLTVSGTSLLATAATTVTIGSTGADTIILGNGGADSITIGNAASTSVSITDDNWNVTSAGLANFVSIGAATPGTGAFTTLTSSGSTTLGTGSSTTNTFGSGASSINTIGSSTTPGALTLHGATSLDNTFTINSTVSGSTAINMSSINLTNQTTSGTQRGLVISQVNDASQTETTEQLAYLTNLDLTSTVTDGLLIEQNASGSTMTNGLHITNTAGTLTSAITIDGAGGAPSSKILDTASLDISGAGAISGATGLAVLGATTINNSGSGTTTIGNASSNTTINVGSDATGDLLYRSSGGNLNRLAVGSAVSVLIGGTTPSYSTSSGNSLCLQSNSGNTALTWASCGGSSPTLDAILAAAGDGSAQNNANHPIIWNWDSITTQTGLSLGSSATGVTTGGLLAIGSSTLAFAHTATETGNVATITFKDTSSTGLTTTVTNGLQINPTINATSGGVARTINGLSVEPSFTACSAGTCTVNGVNVGSVTDGTGFTGSAINIGGGWDYDIFLKTDGVHTLKVQDQDTAATAGSDFQILGAQGNTTGTGGSITLTAGAGGSGANNAQGGALTLTSGAGLGTGLGGALTITSGAGGATNASGAVNIASGAGKGTGLVSITSGNVSSGTSGNVTIDVGTGGTAGSILIGTGGIAKTITIGTSGAFADTINLGVSSTAQTINVGNGSTSTKVVFVDKTAAPGAELSVNGQVFFGSIGTNGTSGRIWVHSNAKNFRFNSASNTADYSEFIAQSEPSEQGDIMVVDADHPETVHKSQHAYEENILGVITVTGTSNNNGGCDDEVSCDRTNDPHWANVGMLGQVRVKVSLENGPIAIGDRLTTSSTPGVAMKATQAGQIIGRALEAYTSPTETNKVMTLISPSYFDPQTDGHDSDIAQLQTEAHDTQPYTAQIPYALNQNAQSASNFGKYSIQGIIDSVGKFSSAIIANLKAGSILSQEVTTDNLLSNRAAVGDLTANTGTVDGLVVNTIQAGSSGEVAIQLGANNELQIQSDTGVQVARFDSVGNAWFNGTLTADRISANHIDGLDIITDRVAQLETNQQQMNATLASLEETLNAYIASQGAQMQQITNPPQISPTGIATLEGLLVNNNATISGNLHVGGSSLIEGVLNVIDSITSKNIVVTEWSDFMGNVITRGNVSFLGRPTFNNDSAGFAVIKQGQDKIDIAFDQEYAAVPVVTANLITDESGGNLNDQEASASALLSQNIKFIITRRSTRGFSIKVNSNAPSDLTFSWAAVAVQDAKTVGGASPTPSPTPTSIPSPSPTFTPTPTVIEPTPSSTPTPSIIEPSPTGSP